MKKLFGFILKYVIVNLLLIALFTIGGISFMTGQFPPKVSTIKEYVGKVVHLRDSYKDMLSKSNAAITQQLGAEMALTPEQMNGAVPAYTEPAVEGDATAAGAQSDQIRQLNKKIMDLYGEINRLQNENHALRTSLSVKQ